MMDILLICLAGIFVSAVVVVSLVLQFSKEDDKNSELACPGCKKPSRDIRLVSEVVSGNEIKSTYKCSNCKRLIRKSKKR